MKIRYCDGASFSGYVKEELQVWFAYFPTNVLYNHYVRVLFCAFLQNGTRFYFRGQRIWEAVMNELVFKGLRNAKQVITCIASRVKCLLSQKIKGRRKIHFLFWYSVGMIELYESISHHLYSWTYCAPYVFLIWSSEGYIIITKCVTGARSV